MDPAAPDDQPKQEPSGQETAPSTPMPPSVPPATPPTSSPPQESVEVVEEGPVEKSRKKLYIAGLLILALVVLVSGFFFLKISPSQEEKTIAPQEQPSPTPTSTPQPAFDRSEWSLEVLNGSGITGAAAKTAEKLREAGYIVVKTGNADNDNYEETQLLVTKSMQDRADLLLEDIRKILHVATVSGELKNSTASARLIIGKD